MDKIGKIEIRVIGKSGNNELSPEKINLESEVNQYFFNKNIKTTHFNIEINKTGVSKINSQFISLNLVKTEQTKN